MIQKKLPLIMKSKWTSNLIYRIQEATLSNSMLFEHKHSFSDSESPSLLKCFACRSRQDPNVVNGCHCLDLLDSQKCGNVSVCAVR